MDIFVNAPLGRTAIIPLLLALFACAAPQGATRTVPADKQAPPASAEKPAGSPAAGTGTGSDVEEAIRKGMMYLDQGNPAAAQALLEKMAKSHDADGRLHNALGVVYKHEGKTDQAIEAYKKAIALRVGHIEAYYNLGILYREKGRFKEAESEYRHALFLKPDFAPAHFNLGVLYDLYLNRPKDALEQYKQYKKLGGTNEKVDIWIKDLERRTGQVAPPQGAAVTGEVP